MARLTQEQRDMLEALGTSSKTQWYMSGQCHACKSGYDLLERLGLAHISDWAQDDYVVQITEAGIQMLETQDEPSEEGWE